jgi:hypothetical protein
MLKKNVKRAENLAPVFAREIWRLQGIPSDIVSDWDSRLTSKTWYAFLTAIGMNSQISTAFHPTTDIQTVRVNQIIEALLKAFLNLEITAWAELV